MTIHNLREAEEVLRPYVPAVKQLTGRDTTLDRISPLMDAIGNPESRLKVVHIAGTSGKTSTAYYMAALLSAAGQKTGLTISPHISSITERLQINGQPLSEEEFCAYLSEFMSLAKKSRGAKPSYFELLCAFALWVFDLKKVDYAVVETGLGGLHDATNITARPDKICIITDIGLDHTSVLGKTLAQIAVQKIGIAHMQNHVFTYRQSDQVMSVFEDWCKSKKAYLHVFEDKAISYAPNMPGYQMRNWQLAYETLRYLCHRDDLPYLTRQVLEQTRQVTVPGRMQIIQKANKTLVMDGAHNQQKMSAFISSFRELYPDVKPAVLVALKDDKNYAAVAPLLAEFGSRFVITTFSVQQDLLAQSLNPENLAAVLKAVGVQNIVIEPDQKKAYQTLIDGPEPLCVITGSFYLIAQISNNEKLE